MSKYIIVKPEKNCGMCGYIWQVIRAIYQNPEKKYYIDFQNSIYKSKSNENVWDCFFEQPCVTEKPNSSEVEDVVGILWDQKSEFIYKSIIPNTKEEIQKRRNDFSKIISTYLIPKENIRMKIADFVKKNFEGNRVLGVHFRGTDHPEKKPMHQYMQHIKDIISKYDKIFICSDEYDRFRMAEVAFGKKVISWDSIRSKEEATPLHSHPSDPRYNRNGSCEYQYKIAEDVIVEAYLLSKVDFLFCCSGSNVNYLARAINPNLDYVEL